MLESAISTYRYFFPRPHVVPKYQTGKTLEERKSESEACRKKYPGYVPVVIETSEAKSNTNLPLLPRGKNKFLVPANLDFGAFQYTIRKRLKLPSDTTLFFYTCDNIMLHPGVTMFNLDEEKTDSDGYLYVIISLENDLG